MQILLVQWSHVMVNTALVCLVILLIWIMIRMHLTQKKWTKFMKEQSERNAERVREILRGEYPITTLPTGEVTYTQSNHDV